MTFIEKINRNDVIREINEFYDRYGFTPAVAILAAFLKTTPKTIHVKLNELEAEGRIKQIKKVKNTVKYVLKNR